MNRIKMNASILAALLIACGILSADAKPFGIRKTTLSTLAIRGGNGEDPSLPIKVAYQGEPGAYSEKSTRELLGDKVTAVGHPSFEDCFRAVASGECDYACLPVENSLGGSIHENYDLMLRYDLTIVGEHEFRVKHCLLAKPGVKRERIKYAISHPQALAQCDNFLRGLGITPVPTYDTAGSAKMIADGQGMPERPKCTPDNTAAIASDLAAKIYGLNCLDRGIEDDDTNFTRFLLLSRKDVTQFLTKKIPAKTSVVFTLPNTPGALYKALASFSLRDIDFSKIESRPTSASLLNYLKFKSQQMGKKSRNKADLPRFRYCFYLDFLANQLDENTQNALAHLREQADFVRILGSYPQKSRLVGPISRAVEQLRHMTVDPKGVSIRSADNEDDIKPLNIGIVGFEEYGQLLAKRLAETNRVSCLDLHHDKIKEANKIGVEHFSRFDTNRFLHDLDIVVFAVPLIEFEDAIMSLPIDAMKGKLLVETCVLSKHPKSVMLRKYGNRQEIDLLSTHPMLGATNTEDSPFEIQFWDGRPFVYEKIRVGDIARCEQFLKVFEDARCQMVEMSAEQHDDSIADAEFVTHLTGLVLNDKLLPPSPVLSPEYAALCDVTDAMDDANFDKFYGMFKHNPRAHTYLSRMRDNVATLLQQIAAKEAYLQASSEMKNTERKKMLEATKDLLKAAVKDGLLQINDTAPPPRPSKAPSSLPGAEASKVSHQQSPSKPVRPSPPSSNGDSKD